MPSSDRARWVLDRDRARPQLALASASGREEIATTMLHDERYEARNLLEVGANVGRDRARRDPTTSAGCL